MKYLKASVKENIHNFVQEIGGVVVSENESAMSIKVDSSRQNSKAVNSYFSLLENLNQISYSLKEKSNKILINVLINK